MGCGHEGVCACLCMYVWVCMCLCMGCGLYVFGAVYAYVMSCCRPVPLRPQSESLAGADFSDAGYWSGLVRENMQLNGQPPHPQVLRRLGQQGRAGCAAL